MNQLNNQSINQSNKSINKWYRMKYERFIINRNEHDNDFDMTHKKKDI